MILKSWRFLHITFCNLLLPSGTNDFTSTANNSQTVTVWTVNLSWYHQIYHLFLYLIHLKRYVPIFTNWCSLHFLNYTVVLPNLTVFNPAFVTRYPVSRLFWMSIQAFMLTFSTAPSIGITFILACNIKWWKMISFTACLAFSFSSSSSNAKTVFGFSSTVIWQYSIGDGKSNQ